MEKIRISRAMFNALDRGVLYNFQSTPQWWGDLNFSRTKLDDYQRSSASTVAQLVMLNLVRPLRIDNKLAKLGGQALEAIPNWRDKIQLETHKICCPSCGNVFRYEDRKRREK